MSISKAVALTIALALAGPLAAHAQATSETSQATAPLHHYHVHHFENGHHHVYHRFEHHPAAAAAIAAPVVAAPTPAVEAQPSALAFPHIAPYANGKGDEDGLSTNVDDCNKGCIDGNPN